MNQDQMALLRELALTFGVGVLVLVAVVALGVYLAVRYAVTRIEAQARASIDRELDRHKVALDLSADAIRVDFQRRIQDFGELNSRRHRAYQRLYRELLNADGAFAATTGGMLQVDYSKKSAAEISAEIKRLGLGDTVHERVLAKWDGDRASGVKTLEGFLVQAGKNRALQAHQRFRNVWLLRELYISHSVRDALEVCNKTMAAASAELLSSGPDELRLLHLVKRDLQIQTASVREAMQADLSRGDYDQPVQARLPTSDS